ncbi:MAG: hypothetical protein NNA21_04500 [Nitrospira sp.]|nr:hypothetical protein [Nitrospira sp.]
MKKLLTIFAVLSLSGCTTETYWYFPYGGTEQQFRRDDYACIQEAQQQTFIAFANSYGGMAHSDNYTNIDLYKACMRSRGYREADLPN